MPFQDILRKLIHPRLFGGETLPPEKLPQADGTIAEDAKRGIKQDAQHACPAYTQLKYHFRDIGRMNAIIETLGRDFLTAMPAGAYKSRLGHIAFLFRRMHEDLSSSEIRHLLDSAQDHEYNNPQSWDQWDRANLREMSNLYRMYCCISPELMEKKARLSYEGRRHHSTIKKTGDWEQAKGFLSEQIDLHRRIAEERCETFHEDSHYQMLMQEHMPTMTTALVERLFGDHKEFLDGLMPKVLQKQSKQNTPIPLDAEYEKDAQMWLNRSLLRVIGFDFKRGGLYETGHNPVEGGTPEDTRLVISNVDESNFMDSMKSALHEGGHGIYIQGLPRKEWRYQPVAMDLGAVVHESQALLIEMIIGRMPEFFEFLSPRLEGLFHGINSPVLSPENLFAIKTRVKPQIDRKKADEVTYFYHVLMRFELERDLIEGRLPVEKLPEAWVEKMHGYLGVYPENHLEGCLQDVHWFVGKFGYFPSYVLGHMLGAQIYESLDRAIPGMANDIAHGNFVRVKDWLNNNIYSRGRLMQMHDLVRSATGAPFSGEALKRHLKQRYLM
jgi:carboxypeptidase Taq